MHREAEIRFAVLLCAKTGHGSHKAVIARLLTVSARMARSAILQRGTEIEHGSHKAVIAGLLTVSARIGHGITYSLTCTLTYHVPENGAVLRFPT